MRATLRRSFPAGMILVGGVLTGGRIVSSAHYSRSVPLNPLRLSVAAHFVLSKTRLISVRIRTQLVCMPAASTVRSYTGRPPFSLNSTLSAECGHTKTAFLVTDESFYGTPPNISLTKSLPAVSPEMWCPLPPRRHRSIVLYIQEST